MGSSPWPGPESRLRAQQSTAELSRYSHCFIQWHMPLSHQISWEYCWTTCSCCLQLLTDGCMLELMPGTQENTNHFFKLESSPQTILLQKKLGCPYKIQFTYIILEYRNTKNIVKGTGKGWDDSQADVSKVMLCQLCCIINYSPSLIIRFLNIPACTPCVVVHLTYCQTFGVYKPVGRSGWLISASNPVKLSHGEQDTTQHGYLWDSMAYFHLWGVVYCWGKCCFLHIYTVCIWFMPTVSLLGLAQHARPLVCARACVCT